MTECYTLKPAEVEVFHYDSGTDVIMRRNIRQVEKPVSEKEDPSAVQLTWECDEWQFREPGILTADQVKAEFDRYWGYTPPKPEEEKSESDYVTYGDMRKALQEGVNSL